MPEGFRGMLVRGGGAEVGMGRAGGDDRAGGNDGGEGMREEDGEGVQEEEDVVGQLEEVGAFEEVVVWGHERVVEGDDGFVRGLEEWVGFAEVVSSSRWGSGFGIGRERVGWEGFGGMS